ncbi:MAG: AAA family ATPase [Proteobacteria bacterium]|nr:AAA family ATPase [Pseudomonadota bacterium]MBU1687998.1 AAA family ATPase [Pseudomonadota bacterium]
MYNKHFNLEEKPFSIAPDPRFLYMSEKHREALAHLLYGLKSDGGFILLTGEVGTGKTTVFRCLLDQLPEGINLAFVFNPKLSSEELLATVCDELGIEYPATVTSSKLLVDAINRYLLKNHSEGRKTVLVIDEAQNLTTDVLEQVRLLTNLETNQRKLLQIIMIGQPELRDLLSRPELRQLAQRITARYHLGPLSRREIGPYINHRLAVAGHRKKIFSDRVISSIHDLTGGIPRLINVLCDRALLGTYVQGRDQVNQKTLFQAAREVFGDESRASRFSRGGLLTILGIALLAGFAFFLFFFTPRSGLWNLETKQSPLPLTAEIELQTTPSEEPVIPEPSPLLPPVSHAVDSKTPEPVSRIEWPTDLPREMNLTIAFETLFAQWNLPFAQEDSSRPCEKAWEAGLDCLERSGSLGSLSHLNRPAILNLLDQDGVEFFATLIRLDDHSATFRFRHIETTISRDLLEKQWSGNYSLLWRLPDGFQVPIHPDRKGTEVDWLREQLLPLPNEAGESPPPLAPNALTEAVKSFQRKEGLKADGIAGPETIIHLQSYSDQPTPHLRER